VRTLPAPRPPATASAAPAPTPATPAAPPAPKRWDGQAVLSAPETAQVAFAAWSGDPAVVVPSPPGAGKTRLTVLLAAYLADRAGLHVGIAAQTREQAVEIARRAGQVTGHAKLLWPSKKNSAAARPACGATAVVSGGQAQFPTDGGGIIIATTARWLYGDPRALGCHLMIVDEAWQATFADLGALGAFAGQVVCVGDPGQIDPVVTGATTRWQHSPHGPHLPAPAALLAKHGEAITVVALRHTWRLGPQTTALVQPVFYPSLPFTSRRPAERITGPAGAVPEIAHQAITTTAGPGDPLLPIACADRVRALLGGHTVTTGDGSRPLAAADVAVVTAHVTQACAVRALLASEPDVLVGTANQIQGLERPAVVALHPAAGYRDLSAAFGTDLGRACVMLSRHRAHLTVVTDTITPAVLAAAPGNAAATQAALLDRLLATPAA
jgi:AAA domain